MSGILNTGKLSTLLTRLSATWAAKLDSLESRLSAARAGYLDLLNTNLDAKVSSAGQRVPTAFPAWTAALNQVEMDTGFAISTYGLTRYPRFISATHSVSTLNAWEDIVNIAGAGVMQFLAIWQDANASDRDTDLRIIIDDVTVLTVTAMWNVSSVRGKQGNGGGGIFVGFMEWDTTSGGLQQGSMVLENLAFKTSFVVQHRITESGGGTQTAHAFYRHYLT